MTKDYDGKIDSVIVFDVQYQSVTGKKYKEILSIDMSEHKGMYQLGKPHLYSIAQSLEAIPKDIGHLVSGFKRVRTDIYTSEDRKAENEALRKRFEDEHAKHGA